MSKLPPDHAVQLPPMDGDSSYVEFPWETAQAGGYGERLQRMTSKMMDDAKR